MGNMAYLRVSGDRQDVMNQKHGILEYANHHGITDITFIEDCVTSRKPWRERGAGEVLAQAESGDIVIVSEVSRFARTTLEVLEILKLCTEKNINLHIAKNSMRFDDSMQSRITATVLAMAAEIEREFISTRTKEALAAKKAAGVKLGRPRGKAKKLRLDQHREDIEKYLDMGLTKVAISKLIDCPVTTLYDYCRVRKL